MIKIFENPRTDFTNVEFDKLSYLLKRCNQDFYPPLSLRTSTYDKNLNVSHDMIDADKFPMEFYMSILKQPIIIYEVDNTFIGLLSFKHNFIIDEIDCAPMANYVTTTMVDRDYRGCGVAQAMMLYIEHALCEGLKSEYTTVRFSSTNHKQLHIHKKLGYREIGRKLKYKPDADMIYMCKNTNK
jgi:ribosomal protein S18 acetylase RimI-like enzyme